MPCCDTGRNIQKYKGATASTLQDVTDNGNTTTGDIITTSGYFIGDGSKLTNIPGVSGAAFTLEQVTAQGNWTSNTVDFQNAHTAFTTDLNSNVLVKLDQLSNVIITDPDDHKSLVYNSGNWIDDYIDFTSIEVKAGENLVKGNIVYVSGATGDTPIVHKADSSDPTKMPAVGVVMDGHINQNNNGHVVTFGVFSMPSLNPNFQVGEILYVSNTAVGELMNTVPFGNTDKIQNVGICVKSGGKILVTGVGRANDIPNAEVVTSQPAYIYVNSTGNELKKISASSLNTNVNTLQQVTDVGNTTSNTIQFTNTSTSIITSGNVIVGTNVHANEYYGDGTNLTGIALSSDLTDNVIRIGNLETNLTDNSSRITTVANDLTNNVIRIDNLETNLTDNSSRISTLETEIQPVNRGGTGLTSFVSGDLIYANGTSSFTNLAASSSTQGYFLKNDNGVPTWADVSLVGSASPYSITAGSGLSGGNYNGSSAVTWTVDFSVVASTSNLNSNVTRISTLENEVQPVNRGGTGLTSYTVGDLLYASGTTTITNLGVGSSGQVLTVNGTGTAPEWAASTGYWVQTNSNIYYASGFVGIANTSPINTLDIGSNVSVIDDGVDKLVIRGNVYSTHDIVSLGTVHADIIKARDMFVKNTTVVAERPTRQVRLN